MKTCSRCSEEKPLDEYYLVKRTGKLQAACKRCTCDAAKVWRDANPEKFRGAIRRAQLLRKYGITVEKYDAMFESQGGACALCGVVPEGNLHVDHNHKTGAVRALLCMPCNTGIGMFQEDATLLRRAASYLEKW